MMFVGIFFFLSSVWAQSIPQQEVSQCFNDKHCLDNEVCRIQKCIHFFPFCKVKCGINAKCRDPDHFPYCSCIPGYVGDPTRHCILDESLLSHPNVRLLPMDKCGHRSHRSIASRIIGGTNSSHREHPWMAKIFLTTDEGKNVFHCGGSIINNKYVLTAAHCCRGINTLMTHLPKDVKIYIGDNVYHLHRTVMDVESMEIHPGYSSKDSLILFENDICLIRVKGVIKYKDDIQPICLPFPGKDPKFPGGSLSPGTIVEVIGWGYTTEGQEKNPTVLQKNLVEVYHPVACYFPPNYNRQICVSPSSYHGDSGGPLMSSTLINGRETYFQYGIVSSGMKLPIYYASKFINVPEYLTWILNNIRK